MGDALDYLEQHRIHLVLEQLVGELVKAKPSDPLHFLVEHLETMQQQQQQQQQKEEEQRAEPPAEAPAPAPITDIHSAEALDALRQQFTAKAVNGVLSRPAFVAILDTLISDDAGQKSYHVRELGTIFDAFDVDRNGAVDIVEFTAGIKVLFSGGEEERLAFAFQGLDTDGDGTISKEEFMKHFKRFYAAQCAVDGI
eukprot:EG_transcript_31617